MIGRGYRVGLRPIFWMTGDESQFQRALAIGEQAERLGFDGLFFGDRLLAAVSHGAVPVYTSTHPDIVTVLAAFAARTTRVRIGSLVVVVPFRHPVQLAKAFASLDLLAAGRTVLGVGGGWNAHEFATLGIPRTEAGARLEEGLSIMRRLWTEDHVDYPGRFYQLRDVTIEPKPVQPGGPPIWFGALQPPTDLAAHPPNPVMVERVLRRVARCGDGWVPLTYSTLTRRAIDPAWIGEAWGRIRTYAREAGRDPRHLQYVSSHWYYVIMNDADRQGCERSLQHFFGGTFDEAVETYLIGAPDDILRKLERLVAPIDRVDWYIFTQLGLSDRQAELLAEHVVPHLR
jgi:probable F420-dependent oxidoreductase